MVGRDTMISKAFAKKLLSKGGVIVESASELDFEFYRSAYPDLVKLSNAELVHHWCNNGIKEGRYSSATALAKANSLKPSEINFDLDLEFYLCCYRDVRQSGVETELQARLHWLKFGRYENRAKCLDDWLVKFNLKIVLDLPPGELVSIVDKNTHLSFEQVMGTLCGEVDHLVKFKDNSEENADFYMSLADAFFKESKESKSSLYWYQAALKAAQISFNATQCVKALELIADCHSYHGDIVAATTVYHYLYEKELHSDFLFEAKYSDNLLKQNKSEKAIEILLRGIHKKPGLSHLQEKLDIAINKLFQDLEGEKHLKAMLDDREGLSKKVYELAKLVYDAYFQIYSKDNTPCVLSVSNLEKVLIVGDYHVQQCVRYRIDQKIEQLESQGKRVTAIDWTELEIHQNEIALHDIVIFYRVPAVPRVLKAMAQVNANGKASFYEIDDLLFEECYPAPLETFGSYIGLDTHIELRKSMASFRAAVSFCRFGIASTQLLCDKLEKLVMDKQCILHRNGLDKLNVMRYHDKSNKTTIDIFYGSGTQAHNSDFIEQALPALEKVLDKHKHTRLIIAGYLQLPQEFIRKYKNQLLQLPPVKNVEAYWSFLERADINLAVLNDDEINGCKSELKWFEAACFGIPSVVSTTANHRDVINHGEDAFIAVNEIEWVRALEALIASSELRQTIAAKALQRVQTEYSVEALGAKLTTNLDDVLEPDKTRKKKIALVNVFFPPQAIGGATRVLADNFDVLQKQYGDDFELVVFTSDDHCTDPYKLTTYQHQGVTVYRSTILYRENMDWHPKDPEIYKLFEQFLEIEQPDLVHFHCVQRLTASVVEAAKDKDIPYLVTIHDAWWISDHQFLIDADDNVYPDGHPDIYAPRTLPNKVTLGDSIERIIYFQELLNGASKLLTVSESFADIYRKNGYPQIDVNKNGISSTVEWLPKQTQYSGKVVCGHIGGMANHKGYFLLKEAIEQEQPQHIEMLVVDHSKPEGYEQKTFWGQVPVTFIGRMGQTGIAKLYQQIDVLFAPSMWPESYGLVTREAAACGCWVVASNLGGIGEDIIEGKSGIRIEPSLKGIRKAVKEIDRSANKFKQNSQQSDIRLVDKQVEELVNIYKL